MRVLLIGDASDNECTAALVRRGHGIAEFVTWNGGHGEDAADISLPLQAGATVSEVVKSTIAARIDLVVLTSQWSIFNGYANALQTHRIPCFGPTRVASYFCWDLETTAQMFRRINQKNSSGRVLTFDYLQEIDTGIAQPGRAPSQWFRYVAMVCEGKVTTVSPGDASVLVSQLVTIPLLKAAEPDSKGYCGWFSMDVCVLQDEIKIAAINCSLPPVTLSRLAGLSGFDFLSTLRKMNRSTRESEPDLSVRIVSGVPVRLS